MPERLFTELPTPDGARVVGRLRCRCGGTMVNGRVFWVEGEIHHIEDSEHGTCQRCGLLWNLNVLTYGETYELGDPE